MKWIFLFHLARPTLTRKNLLHVHIMPKNSLMPENSSFACHVGRVEREPRCTIFDTLKRLRTWKIAIWKIAIILFLGLPLMLNTSVAWNIGTKGRINASSVHTSYFLTPNNQSFDVSAKAYVGAWVNNYCLYDTVYDLGVDKIKTGDFIDIDAYALKSIIGGGYSCMSIYYTYQQLVIETFQLLWDGFNYRGSIAELNEVSIL